MQAFREHHRLYFVDGAWIRLETIQDSDDESVASTPLCSPFSSCDSEGDIVPESSQESCASDSDRVEYMSDDFEPNCNDTASK